MNVFTIMIPSKPSAGVPMTATRGHSTQIIAYSLCSVYQVSLFPAVCHKPCKFPYLYTVHLELGVVVLHCVSVWALLTSGFYNTLCWCSVLCDSYLKLHLDLLQSPGIFCHRFTKKIQNLKCKILISNIGTTEIPSM